MTISPQVKRFNAMVEEFDMLTGNAHGRATPKQIFDLWLCINPSRAFEFGLVCVAAGEYFESASMPQTDIDAK